MGFDPLTVNCYPSSEHLYRCDNWVQHQEYRVAFFSSLKRDQCPHLKSDHLEVEKQNAINADWLRMNMHTVLDQWVSLWRTRSILRVCWIYPLFGIMPELPGSWYAYAQPQTFIRRCGNLMVKWASITIPLTLREVKESKRSLGQILFQ